MRKIALIACVKEKQALASPALEMYIGKEFKRWVAHAKKNEVNTSYILSGKYGLLLPHEIIEPYDFNLNNRSCDERKVWASKVIRRLQEFEDLDATHVSLYCNETYAEFLLEEIPFFAIPFQID